MWMAPKKKAETAGILIYLIGHVQSHAFHGIRDRKLMVKATPTQKESPS